MLPLTKKELKLHQDAKMCYFVKEDLHKTFAIAIKMVSICNLPNEIPVIFHNGSNYDYQGQFECLRENTEK